MTRDMVPPALADLLARYLQQQTTAHGEGLGLAETGDVVPHEAAPVQPIEPRLAWDEALAALRCFQPQVEIRTATAPPDWPALVAAHEPATALAFCAGNFPQMVRHLHALLQADTRTAVRQPEGRPAAAPGLVEWARQTAARCSYPQMLLAIGALRLARHYDAADELLTNYPAPAEWQAAWANEQAALAWCQGRTDEAVARWQAQPESAPVLFNRGMAALFLGRPAEARVALARAVALLTESSAWHHLARLYLALAEMRG
jgi:hypothetical protein